MSPQFRNFTYKAKLKIKARAQSTDYNGVYTNHAFFLFFVFKARVFFFVFCFFSFLGY